MPEPSTTSTVVVSPSSRKKLRDGMCSREYLRMSLFQCANCTDHYSCRCSIWRYCLRGYRRCDGSHDKVHRRRCDSVHSYSLHTIVFQLSDRTSRILPNNSPDGYRSNARGSVLRVRASIIFLSMLLIVACHTPVRPVSELDQATAENTQSAA